MMENSMTKIEIPELLLNVYRDAAIRPLGILQNYALNLVQGKIHKYEAEDAHFRKKYSCDFHKFRADIEAMEDEENFEWEDDLMDWEFAAENLSVWQKKEQEVRSLWSR
mgnify:CR=1 FL=1